MNWTKIIEWLSYDQARPMLFNSGVFLFVFLAFFIVYTLTHRQKNFRIIYVTLFSFFFYYKSSGIFFVLLIISTIVDYVLGQLLYQSRTQSRRKLYLFLSILTNLGILGYFKYTNFFIGSINSFFSEPLFSNMDIFLPVGISFYTFQTMSYTIDIYRRKLEPVDNILDFAFFVSFFPQLVAGPIVRAADFLPQIRQDIFVTREQFGKGIFFICIGLFKKAVISDYISVNFVDRVFNEPLLYTGFENLMAVYGYAMQIYCDFSGYSDIAIGLGLLMGYKLPLNFLAPYQSGSITEFWRRWHISLSSWLRDYLYISLGGNRKGKIRTYINLMLTMLLGGLWHGPAWRFVIWGGMHGLLLAIERLIKQYINVPKNTFTRVLGVLFTFHFVCFCWIFFRATTYDSAIHVIQQITFQLDLSVAGEILTSGYYKVFLLMLIGFILHFIPLKVDKIVEEKFTYSPLVFKAIVLAIVIWMVVQAKSADVVPFIYFQF